MKRDFIPLARPDITDDEIREVSEVLKSGYLTTGPKVYEFERCIEDYIGEGTSALALNSCTAGLFLSLLDCGIGPGDEIILPTWTFAATGHVVIWTGAKPVLCDIDADSLNIDPEKLRLLITPKTKAIMPVHFAGYPCEMDEILNLAKKNGLVVIEDAAHAIGTQYKGSKVGSLGDITAFSFYATKNLTCGEGGMLVSRDAGKIERIRKMSYFGINKEAFKRYTDTGNWYYEIEGMGYKYNMDNIHAAIGLMQLKRLDVMNKRRRKIASIYKQNLDSSIRFSTDDANNYHTYHLFTIRIDRNTITRDDLVKGLKAQNIGTSVHFIPLHRHPYYKDFADNKRFPVADSVFEEVVSLPMFPGMSDDDVYYVIENVNRLIKRR